MEVAYSRSQLRLVCWPICESLHLTLRIVFTGYRMSWLAAKKWMTPPLAPGHFMVTSNIGRHFLGSLGGKKRLENDRILSNCWSQVGNWKLKETVAFAISLMLTSKSFAFGFHSQLALMFGLCWSMRVRKIVSWKFQDCLSGRSSNSSRESRSANNPISIPNLVVERGSQC